MKTMESSNQAILNGVMKIKSDMDSIKRDIDSIQVKESSNIVSPIRTAIKPIVSETYLNYMFPGLIALVVMLVSLLFAQTLVMMEKKSSAYFRNMVTPTKEGLFIFSNFLTTFLLIMLQTSLILMVSTLVFKVDIFANILPTTISLLMIIALFTLMGVIIGMVFSSQETSTLAAVTFGSIALFLSDVILPLESMPTYIMNIARFNPFVLSEYLLRSTIVFNTPIIDLLKEPYSGIMPIFFLFIIYILFFIGLLILSNTLIDRARIAVGKPKALGKKGRGPPGNAEMETPDPARKIEDLINTALQEIKDKEFDKARIIYLHLNELYVLLPPEKKRPYFKKINRIHEELERFDRKR
jgi:ABC-type multidrug transport system permease subunit